MTYRSLVSIVERMLREYVAENADGHLTHFDNFGKSCAKFHQQHSDEVVRLAELRGQVVFAFEICKKLLPLAFAQSSAQHKTETKTLHSASLRHSSNDM